MTTATAKSSEPTIDDILASIRRIIADEQQAEDVPATPRLVPTPVDSTDDVLDLAQPVMRPQHVQPVAAVANVTPAESAPSHDAVVTAIQPKNFEKPVEIAAALHPRKPGHESKPAYVPELHEQQPAAQQAGPRLERLIAGEAEEALAAAFGRISALKVSAETRTLEGLVADLLRPMLKDWLDANLPAIAERLVKQEIERIAAQSAR